MHRKCSDLPEYNAFFTLEIKKTKFMLFMVGVEKIPVFNRNFTKIKRFDYEQYMKFLDILPG